MTFKPLLGSFVILFIIIKDREVISHISLNQSYIEYHATLNKFMYLALSSPLSLCSQSGWSSHKTDTLYCPRPRYSFQTDTLTSCSFSPQPRSAFPSTLGTTPAPEFAGLLTQCPSSTSCTPLTACSWLASMRLHASSFTPMRSLSR